MDKVRNFRARLIEPLLKDKEKTGFGVEFEFHEEVQGLNGDTITIVFNEGIKLEEAEALILSINNMGNHLKVN